MDVSDPRLTDLRKNLIKILYFCRGGNINVLTQYFNGTLEYTEQQKKQMTNQLSRLKDTGLITSRKLEGKNSGSMYYLTPNGLELAKKLFDIYPLQQGEGWQKYPLEALDKNQLKDNEYETYKPPFRQYNHHHLILQSIISLFGKDSNLEPYPFRLTNDAFKNYQLNGQNKILKPDLEIKIGNEIIPIEIDRSTESYSQLVAKFINYKNYLNYLKRKNIPVSIKKVIFVYDDRNSNFGVSRRWETIMKAYLEGMEIKDDIKSWTDIEILFINLRDLSNLINFLNTIPKRELNEIWQDFYYERIINTFNESVCEIKSFGDLSFIGKTESNSNIFFCNYYPCYSSNFYRYLVKFHHNGKSFFNSLEYYHKPKSNAVIIGETKLENWNLNFKNTKIDINLQTTLKYAFKMIRYFISEE